MSLRTVQHPVDAARQRPSMPDPDYGWFYPRWAVLAGILLVPTGIIGEVINVYYASHLCSFGSLCLLDETSPTMQILTIWVAFVALWGLAFALGRRPLAEEVTDHAYGPARPLSRFFWHLSHFERVTPFIYGIGALAFVGMVIAGARGRLDPAVFALGIVALTVALVTLVWWLRLLNGPYARPAPLVALAEPETAWADGLAPEDYFRVLADAPEDAPAATPDYAAMPNYGDIAPAQYGAEAPAPTVGTLMPSGLPSAPRLASLEPPPNPNVDLSDLATHGAPITTPLPATGGTGSAPLPPAIAPLHPDVEAP